MGSILYQRGDICLHGSVVKIGEKAVLLTGDSGAGKSTVSSVLCGRGYPFLADDVAVVRKMEGRVFVYPSYPQKKLWSDAIQSLNVLVEDKTRFKIQENEEKYALCFAEYFWDSRLELSYLYNLVTDEINSVQISQVSGIRRMNVLTQNTYRPFLIKYFGLMEKYFDLCTTVSDRVIMYDIRRPRGLKTQHHIAELIIENSV